MNDQRALPQILHGLRTRFAVADDDSLGLVSRLDTCLGLIDAGEDGVALEILFANLYEFGISLSGHEAAQLMRAAARANVDTTELRLIEVNESESASTAQASDPLDPRSPYAR